MSVAEHADAFLTPNYARFGVEFARGEGARLWDSQGNEYLDFLAGISVSSVGHCHPAVTAAIREQAAALIHVGNLYYTEPMSALARRLSESSLGGKVFFTNSGTEAVEAAIKCARKARQGGTIVSVLGAFHGRTYGSLSATPQEAKQAPFAPLVGGFVAVAPARAALDAAIDEATAAVILETIQGESGVHVLDDDLLRFVRERCDETATTLIFDEIQTGLGRTGYAWDHLHSGVVPDLMTSAKALGGGLPIGALITGERHADTFSPGDHGSTFAGGAVVCAAALAALDVLLDEDLHARVRELGEFLREGVAALPHVVTVRGRGLMIGFDVDLDAPEIARRALLEQRLVINATGPVTLRLLPPLIISEAQAQDCLARLRALLG
ncbi:MAG TPA: acetylornithine/succinylornithine family transaminase [Solirubrobacteraceae bacterium]|jgi:predicted acetylornithine/succinylornithine family transaminase|nr:acetylornithine/succinylornithine family transaminase [Solirubrobacteraceae bacterium]